MIGTAHISDYSVRGVIDDDAKWRVTRPSRLRTQSPPRSEWADGDAPGPFGSSRNDIFQLRGIMDSGCFPPHVPSCIGIIKGPELPFFPPFSGA